jgi:hypothetical protein
LKGEEGAGFVALALDLISPCKAMSRVTLAGQQVAPRQKQQQSDSRNNRRGGGTSSLVGANDDKGAGWGLVSN